jgi:DNA-binding winged helix-turn-helix (wHTH) protein/TolB-like protein/tetratricopeptide (TPR) repeat protein
MSDYQHQYAFGPFLLNPAQRELLRDRHVIPLPPKAFDTLVVLVQNPSRLLEKAELLEAVWHDTFVEEGNLCVTVSLLRKAFGDEHGYIKTVSKRGYRFVAEVNVLQTEACTVRQEYPEVTPAVQKTVLDRGGGTMVSVGESRLTRRAAVLFAGVLGGILLALYVWLSAGATIHATKTLEIRSLAVLPFETLGAKVGDEYLGLGMADALISKLGSTAKIVTRPTRAIQKYYNTSQDPRAAGREQGVDAVVDGCIQRAGDRVRVTAQLIRVADGMQLWAGTFDEEFTNLFTVEDTVSTQVAGSIRLEVTAWKNKERLAKPPSKSSEAYQSYLIGRYFWNERTGKGLEKGLDYLKHAIDLDPTYAEAYAGIADSYAMLGLYTERPPNEAFPKAKAAATKALELDSELAEAHATLGFVHFYYDWDGMAAEREFSTALQENPNYAMAHSWRGFNLVVMGRSSEAIREARLAQAADPVSAIIGTNAAWVYFLAGQDDQALAVLQRVIEINPDFPRAHFRLGNIYEHMSQYPHAIAEYEKAILLSAGDTYYQASLGHAYAMSGRIAGADESLHKLEELSAKRYVPPYSIALIYVGMGDKDRAFEWLERASTDRSTSMAYLNLDPTLNGLQSDPRFATLLQRTKFSTTSAK